MNVALDGTPLTLSSGGLRRFTEELLKALRAEFPEDEFHALSDQLDPPANALDRRWWSVGLPRALVRLGCDVFHGTDFAVPYLPVRASVMSVHDISPWLNPEWHAGAGRVRRRTPLLIRLRAATMLMTGTNAVRKQIVDLFGVAPDRVAVVPDAPAAHITRVQTAPPATPYFLFVGTVEPRKNVPALLAAWRELRARYEVNLVIAGRRRSDGPLILPEEGLIVRGEVSDAEVAQLYSGALALVYPSFYEGFGLPVVEAMQCGTPVITSRDPALMEVAGSAAIAVEPGEIATAMELLLTNEGTRRHYIERATIRARDFSWQRTARLAREVYAEAAQRFWLRRR